MTGAVSAEPMTGSYSGHNIALLTQHDKERVIAAARAPRLDCRIEWVTGYDTDRPGTFVRETPRTGMQLEAARRKTRIGMQMSGLPLGVERRTRWRRLPI